MKIYRVNYAVEGAIDIEADSRKDAEADFWKMCEADGVPTVEGSLFSDMAVLQVKAVKE